MIPGERYAYLLTIKVSDCYKKGDNVNFRLWDCQCSCGKYVKVQQLALQKRSPKSCGCRKYLPTGLLGIMNAYRIKYMNYETGEYE